VNATESITVIVPARNEERHLAGAVGALLDALKPWFADYEVLIFDDASTDGTGKVADDLAASHPRVAAIHNAQSLCLGGVIRKGIALAKMPYVIYVDGKGATSRETLDGIFSRAGQADLIIPYAVNMSQRCLRRRIVSWVFRALLNGVFGLRLRHYNNSILFRTAQVRHVRVRTDSFAFQPEAIIKMIRGGCTYIEVPFEDRFDIPGRKTKAFDIQNVVGVCRFMARTWWDVYIGGRWSPKASPAAMASREATG